uniref:Uncharacterized protein n=1 Tax=Mola mola TaxID=94237 RepID=A0A3Q3XI30_MOLML
MAAPCLRLIPRRWLLTQRSQTPAVRQCLPVAPAAALCSSRTEPHNAAGAQRDTRKAGEVEEEEEPEGPEYIPKKKAKNPMIKIGYAWMIGLPTGIISFLLAKREVDKNRLKQLKVRQRMKMSNEGEYEGKAACGMPGTARQTR